MVGALAVHLGAGAALVAVMLVAGNGRVLALHRALDPGLAGGAVLTIGEILLIPNLVLWAGAVLAGPGFAIGTGTSVSLSSVTLGPLPAVPVLAALPAAGPWPWTALLLLAVPVSAGVLAGVLVVRARHPRDLVGQVVQALGSGGSAGVVMVLLIWLSGGPAGPGRLAGVGPSALLVGAAFGAEVVLGAVVTVLVVVWVPGLLHRMAQLGEPAAGAGAGGVVNGSARVTPGADR
jgi:hypothetical protein